MSTLTPPAPERTFFGQPQGLSTLFMTEMWERFSFYGMRALLVLYLTTPVTAGTPPGPGLGYSTGDAAAIYGTYNSLVYVLPLAGGWIADKLWGARRSVLVGGIIIACGHFSMALSMEATFWLGLLLIAAGTGLLKPNISAIVGGLYRENDERRDAGFSLFYMGINIGAFLAPIICGALEINFGWHIAFACAGFGMVLGLIQYLIGQKNLGSSGLKPTSPATSHEKSRALFTVVGVIAIIVAAVAIDVAFLGFTPGHITTIITVLILVLPVLYFTRLLRAPITTKERSNVKVFILLFIAAAIFWGIYDQAGSTLSVFAEQDVDRTIGDFTVPTAWFQSINPIFIIMFAPIFAWMWVKLADRAPSLPMKFTIALFGIALSFLIMIPPAINADNGQLSSMWWLVAVYLVQTWAELLLSPTGLSATTVLAPKGYLGQMLALWFLATAVGDSVAGQILKFLQGAPLTIQFAVFAGLAIVMGFVLLALVKPMKRLIGDTVT
ncbi:MAG: peptide MFS transporter [Actinomycetes bacterium]